MDHKLKLHLKMHVPNECVFCKIIDRSLPSKMIRENDEFLAIEDREPIAPIHWLVIPKAPISSFAQLPEAISDLSSFYIALLGFTQSLCAQSPLKEEGYRLVINTGTPGGQSVFHFHLHILGGKTLGSFA